MPAIYVSGNLKLSIDLSDDNSTFEFWTDAKLAKERQDLWPNLTLWLEIENPDEPISPFTIPVSQDDVYDGIMSCVQNGKVFDFEFNGKAKANVHKVTKTAVDQGKIPFVSSVAVNGVQKSFDEPILIDFMIQSKKI